MKIAVFDSVSDNYGSSRICRLIVDVMRNASNDVDVWVAVERLSISKRYANTLNFPLLVLSQIRDSPIKYTVTLICRGFIFWSDIKRLLSGYSMVYCNTIGTWPVAFVARLRGFRTILHLHEATSSSIISKLGRILIPMAASRIICVSDAVAKAWGISNLSKTSVVHNGIPSFDVCASAEKFYDVCFVGRLTEKKGIDIFIAALNLISENLTDEVKALKVVIAGGVLPGEPMHSGIKKLSESERLDITFLGEIDDAREVFVNSKVVCVPSLYPDPFPTVVLEAMCAGCSIIASELGGAKEAMDGVLGELVPPGDVNSLAASIVKHVNSWSYDTLKINREAFSKRFTLDHFRVRLLALNIF